MLRSSPAGSFTGPASPSLSLRKPWFILSRTWRLQGLGADQPVPFSAPPWCHHQAFRTFTVRGMSNSCECCKRYWNHLHGKVKCFVRRMNSASRHSMVIPERFVNYFAWEISGTVKLDAPNGNVYDVEVTKRRNRTILESGWEVFVDANHIVENDSMIFRYCGSSCFKVVVFDSSGCEKVVSCTHVKNTASVQEPSTNSTDMSSSSLGPSTQSPASRRSQGCRSESSGHCRKRAKTAATSSSSEEAGENASTDSYGNADSDESLESKNSDRPSKCPYILPSRSHLSQDQIKIIKEKVQAIQSEVPICISIVKTRKHQMEFCGEYAAAHLPRVNETVVLQFMGKIWETKMVVSNCERWHLCRGWSKFADDNLLQVGDICLFELNKNGRKLTMMVHLLRKAGVETFSRGHEEQETIEKSPNHDDTDRTCNPPYMMPLHARLTKVQEKKVSEKVGAIASEFPIYVAVMTKSRILVCLTFATRYSATCLRNGSRNLVLQMEGKSQIWHAELHDVQGALRIGAGWTSFTSDNHLREGDICLFQLMKNEGPPKMIIYIIRGETSTNYADMSSSALCPNTRSSASGRSNGCRSESSGHCRKRAKKAATSSSSETSGENASTDSYGPADCHESLGIENSDRSCKRPYILPFRSRLSQDQIKVIKEKVQAIRSEVPICISIMRKMNIGASNNQMEFCGEYAAAVHLPRVNQTVVLQFMGKIWKTKMSVRSCGRWYLSRGWSKFANDNLLQVGDICLFELKNSERKLTMMVHIIFRKEC